MAVCSRESMVSIFFLDPHYGILQSRISIRNVIDDHGRFHVGGCPPIVKKRASLLKSRWNIVDEKANFTSYASLLFIVVLGIELTSVVLSSILKKEFFFFSKSTPNDKKRRIGNGQRNSSSVAFEVIHPYPGFTLNSAPNRKAQADSYAGFSISSFGLRDDKWPIEIMRNGGVALFSLACGMKKGCVQRFYW